MNFVYKIGITLSLIILNITTNYYAIQIPLDFGCDFFESISCIKNQIQKLKKDSDWIMAKKAYDKHIIHDLIQLEPRIPKIIHQIWVGSPLPEKYKNFQATWIKNHPDWEYKLWTDKDIEEFGLVNKKQYELTKNFGVKSDIARYEILYRFGGLYVDTDFECLRPFDIFHHSLDFYTGMGIKPFFRAFNGLIGSVPGHPILKHCIDNLDIKKVVMKNEALNIIEISGPGFFSKALKKHMTIGTDACVAFPAGYFYPWPYTHRDHSRPEQIQKWIRPETFALHHWHVSWNHGKVPGKK